MSQNVLIAVLVALLVLLIIWRVVASRQKPHPRNTARPNGRRLMDDADRPVFGSFVDSGGAQHEHDGPLFELATKEEPVNGAPDNFHITFLFLMENLTGTIPQMVPVRQLAFLINLCHR